MDLIIIDPPLSPIADLATATDSPPTFLVAVANSL